MAIYIPKDRLGTRREIAASDLMRKIEQKKEHQQSQAHYAKAKEERKAELKEKYESNAEVQRHRSRSKEENIRNAIDLSTKSVMEVYSARDGREVTESEARKVAEGFAYKTERDKEEK